MTAKFPLFDVDCVNTLENKNYLTLDNLLTSVNASSFNELSSILNSCVPRQLIYHAKAGNAIIPTCQCGATLSWNNDKKQYRQYCSKACTGKFSVAKKKEKNLSTIGVEWHSQSSTWAEKVKQTSLEKYGSVHYSKTQEFKDRSAATCYQNYGVTSPAQSAVVMDKIKITTKNRYGVENVAQVPEFKERANQTNLEKYGVPNIAAMHISTETQKLLADPVALEAACNQYSIRELARIHNISVKPFYDRVKDYNIKLPQRLTSTFEREVYNFILTQYTGNVVVSDRDTLYPYHLDLLLPDLNLAIECNGSYWHSELQGRTSSYHLSKTTKCKEQGIQLIHIWEHEWYSKRLIIESMLKHKLNTCCKVGARQLKVCFIDYGIAKDFFINNHLQGWANGAKVCVGLVSAENEILSAMTLGIDRFGKTDAWELLRFASKLGYAVAGGASKLFKYFISQYQPASIVSYSDRATSSGNLYTALGFQFSHNSRPSYKYTKNYVVFESRNKYQKHVLAKKLLVYDSNLSEWQNMRNNGYDRIWDCGTGVYKYYPEF